MAVYHDPQGSFASKENIMGHDFKEFVKAAGNVVPAQRQLDWFDMGMYLFVHFTVNTYTNLEWGLGNEDPAIFNPTELDCDQWVEAAKKAGAKGLILTAKHHDGFCLWPTKYTEHCVRNSPWKDGKGDVVKEAAEACRRGGIKFGFYLSPWDRNSKYYGTPEYNDYYCNQLEELLTGYGDIFEIWFDGACGEGPNGIKQVYDFDRYIALIRKHQPNAVIFNDHGPDVRWCGNEEGSARVAEWSVVPHELCYHAEKQTSGAPFAGGDVQIAPPDTNIGQLSNIMYSEGLVFAGAEIDMSIRPGWFYHENEEPHSLERLFKTYLNSTGHNSCLHLNVPPMPNGKFNEKDVARLEELGNKIREEFGKPLAYTCERREISETQCEYTLTLEKPACVKYVVLAENIAKGQRVESFHIRAFGEPHYRGFTIGHKQICPIDLHGNETDKLEITILAARDTVDLLPIEVY